MNTGRLEKKDYHNGYLQLLEQLTTVDANNISYSEFCNRLDEMQSDIFVIRDGTKVISAGTVYVEKKFIHHMGCVGHIEDVVVDSSYRGHGLGKKIIKILVDHAKNVGCYKVILDCSEKNIGFYEKCGFVRHEVEMRLYLSK